MVATTQEECVLLFYRGGRMCSLIIPLRELKVRPAFAEEVLNTSLLISKALALCFLHHNFSLVNLRGINAKL